MKMGKVSMLIILAFASTGATGLVCLQRSDSSSAAAAPLANAETQHASFEAKQKELVQAKATLREEAELSAELEQRLAEYEAKLAQVRKREASSKEAADTLLAEKIFMSSLLGEVRSTISEIEQEREFIKRATSEQVVRAKNILAKAEKELERLKTVHAEVKTLHQEKTDALDELHGVIAAANLEVARLEGVVGQLQNRFTVTSGEVSNLESEKLRLEGERDKLKEELAHRQAYRAELEEKVKALEGQLHGGGEKNPYWGHFYKR